MLTTYLRRSVLTISLSATLIACGSTGKRQEIQVLIPDDATWQAMRTNPNASTYHLAAVHTRMSEVIPVRYRLALSQQSEINAFATRQNGMVLVVFTNGFLNSFGNDEDILATTLGHELAHHKLGHTDPNRQQSRTVTQEMVSQVLGTIAGYFVPFSGLLVGPAVKTVSLSFNRDDERDADDLGMRWAVQAGYSPCGSYRLSQQLSKIGQGSSFTFLSTHPGNEERMDNAAQFAKAIGSKPCTSNQSPIHSFAIYGKVNPCNQRHHKSPLRVGELCTIDEPVLLRPSPWIAFAVSVYPAIFSAQRWHQAN